MSKLSENTQELPLPSSTSYLSCIVGPEQGKSFPIMKNQLTLGRNTTCDITIPMGLISPQHARLSYENGQYVIYDEDSANGTWVNGKRISTHIVQPHDRIQIGPCLFILKRPDILNQPTAAKPAKVRHDSVDWVLYNLADYDFLEQWTGRTAIVYKARARNVGRVVAVKVLKTRDTYIQDKFVKELEIGKNLNHRYIVPIYSGGWHKGRWYLAMQFMEGQTLTRRLSPGQPTSVEFAVETIGQLCEALAYAHQRGIYHRDIKPSNILFDEQERPKLGDFGIARLAQPVTMTPQGAILGTPAYMATEQAFGQRIDHRADIYSLGAVFYQMLTGHLPFNFLDPLRLIEAQRYHHPLPPRQLNPEVSPELEAIILKAMAKQPEERYQDAEDFAQAIGYKIRQHYISIKAPALGLTLIKADNQHLSIPRGQTILGREQIAPNDNGISRDHAVINYRSGRWWLEDYNSTNGTFLNQQRIFEPTFLQARDELKFGDTKLIVKFN